ncbi:MAG TPA: hypothetical protein DCR17_12370 [Verrucomicrobiales bacterium]|jgi:hypothetical protein|nr:hypothetical protein [Pedosphaera sp.]HAO67466.1 hypothetical protein [Verrucomicrobiales bacterium]HAR00779.1 hypothetical protein [Verrucomicrobiales bacterium]HAW00666.1 hypothetical protein [Verrucomicrobiales bacterium]HCP36906.1 hypothetical protein [Verrucomicrobiales bacterium]|tara:strand:- start:1322 stop:1576 length:255 start_codon:yes stop_codon:yes gene_type:complete
MSLKYYELPSTELILLEFRIPQKWKLRIGPFHGLITPILTSRPKVGLEGISLPIPGILPARKKSKADVLRIVLNNPFLKNRLGP